MVEHTLLVAMGRRAFAALICATAIGSLIADLLFPNFFGPPGIFFAALPLLSFAIVGSFLVLRGAGGPIGWLLGVAGVLFQIGFLSQAYGYASLYAGANLPGGEIVLWLGSASGIALIGFLVSAMVRFPDGRPPGRTFAILLWAALALLAMGTVASALADQPIPVPLPYTGLPPGDPPRSIANPFALHGPVGDLLLLLASAFNNLAALVLIAPLALVVRFRRSRGVERQQLKWLTYTAAITFGLFVAKFLIPAGAIRIFAEAASVFSIGLLPIVIGIAITRYRLYNIDVLIRRTMIYSTLSALLIAAYLAGLALLQTLLAPITAGSSVAVAISTLAVVALFQRLRRRIQDAVDRRFYRSRYDAAGTLDSFAVRLRDEVDLDAVRADLLGAVRQNIAPAHISLWLRERAR